VGLQQRHQRRGCYNHMTSLTSGLHCLSPLVVLGLQRLLPTTLLLATALRLFKPLPRVLLVTFTSDGTTWTSASPTAFLTGMIILWSGSIASIPAGLRYVMAPVEHRICGIDLSWERVRPMQLMPRVALRMQRCQHTRTRHLYIGSHRSKSPTFGAIR
jgi:hypothetical protein